MCGYCSGIAMGAYQLRVRQLAHQFNMRLEERVAERTRIARDLHDTLLQSFQALLPRLQASINMFASRPDDAVETWNKQPIRRRKRSLRAGMLCKDCACPRSRRTILP